MKKSIGVQKRGESFVAYLTHPDGRIEKRTIGRVSLKTAIEQRHVWTREIAEGKYVKPAPRKEVVTFAAIADAAVQHAKNYQRTWDADECRAKVCKEWWGKMPAADIETELIDAKLLDCVKNGRLDAETGKRIHWSQTTSNEYRTWLVKAFGQAVERRELGFNPARKAVRYKLDNARDAELTAAQETKLRNAIRELYAPHVAALKERELDLLLHTGARCSNLYGISKNRRQPEPPLQWSDVDLDGERSEVLGIPVVNFRRSKGGKRYTVPLNSVALAAFNEFRKLSPDGTGPVIRKASGIPLESCRKWLETACKKAGIVGVCPHVLRHTFGTRLRRNKVAFEDYEYLLGHNLAEISLRYAHGDLETLRDAVATLVPKPFLVEKPSQTGAQTVTKTVTSDVSEIGHAQSA